MLQEASVEVPETKQELEPEVGVWHSPFAVKFQPNIP